LTRFFQDHQLEGMREQIEMQKIVIQDLEGKLSDSHALIEKLQVCAEVYFTHTHPPHPCDRQSSLLMLLQADLRLERQKNESHQSLPADPSRSPSINGSPGNGSLPPGAPGSRLNEALSIITALRQSLRT
jgi:hypothetical protein